VIVAGNDRLLLQLVGELDALGEATVFIVAPDHVQLAREAEDLGARVLIGAATDPRVLRDAGIETAHAFAISGVGDDANVHAAFAAAKLNPQLRLVVRIYNLRLASGSRTCSTTAGCCPRRRSPRRCSWTPRPGRSPRSPYWSAASGW